MLAARGEHEQRLGIGVHGLGEDQLAQLLAEGGASGLARHDIGFTISGSCDYLSGGPFTFVQGLDGVGAWRTRDGGTRGGVIDPSGQLVDGTPVNGVVELRQALVREPAIFARTMTEKLLTYALGRGLTATDMPAVRGIVRDAQAASFRFSSIVLGIVRSAPFQMRVTGAAPESRVAATAGPSRQ